MPPMRNGMAGLRDFAERYTAAWCSGQPARVAGFYAPRGSLTINSGSPSVGRDAIQAAAQSFMTALPGMKVTMDSLRVDGECVIYSWTLTGANTGSGGTGRCVCISGFERWLIGQDGLIARSHGQFDEREYERQLRHGAG